jgi:hypothetical protein
MNPTESPMSFAINFFILHVTHEQRKAHFVAVTVSLIVVDNRVVRAYLAGLGDHGPCGERRWGCVIAQREATITEQKIAGIRIRN